MATITQQPEPGQVWERDGERREVVSIPTGRVVYKVGYLTLWCSVANWEKWRSGATLVNGGKADA